MRNETGIYGIFRFPVALPGYWIPVLAIICSIAGFSQEPSCTSLVYPEPGATDVPVTTEISWQPVPNAIRYFISLGTMPGTGDVADRLDTGNALNFLPPSGLLPETSYYLTITPANNSGDAIGCPTTQFTTGPGGGPPGCVTLLYPENGSYGIAPDTDISWYPQSGAAGYLLSLGTSSSTADLLPEQDVGNVTSFSLASPLPFLQQVFVRITPYNQEGELANCSARIFRTRGNRAPLCTEFIDPQDGAQFVSVTANVTWIRDFNAAGYRMTIEERAPGGTRLLDDEDIGNGTNFKPPNFKPNTTYYMTLVPYNDLGAPQTCPAISFTTGNAPDPPGCTMLLLPGDGDMEVATDTGLMWETVSGARGYLLSAGTAPGNRDLVNRQDVGLSTSYTFPDNLPAGQGIYIKIIPYSNWGEAENCPLWSFTTKKPVFPAVNMAIPRFFTPNNDGYNDTWVVESTPEIAVSQVFVFDRYGKLLKQLKPGQAWDGNFRGHPLASDSYWYRIDTADGHSLTGFLLLKR